MLVEFVQLRKNGRKFEYMSNQIQVMTSKTWISMKVLSSCFADFEYVDRTVEWWRDDVEDCSMRLRGVVRRLLEFCICFKINRAWIINFSISSCREAMRTDVSMLIHCIRAMLDLWCRDDGETAAWHLTLVLSAAAHRSNSLTDFNSWQPLTDSG